MSLFGDDDDRTPPSSSRALFSPSFSDRPEASLFDDEPTDGWNVSARPRNTDVTPTLLTRSNAKIPPEYEAIYESLVEAFGGGEHVPARQAAEMVLDDAAVRGDVRERIWGTVIGQKEVLGREEVWCLLALLGVAATDGEEVGLDAVDERRNDLPIPRLNKLAPKTVLKHAHSEEDLPTLVTREQTTPISTEPYRTHSATALFQTREDDPWGSQEIQEQAKPHAVQVMEAAVPRTPVQHQQHHPQHHHQHHPQLRSPIHSPPMAPPSVMSDQFDGSVAEPDDIHAALRRGTIQRQSSANWGGAIYEGPPSTVGGFADTGYGSAGIADWGHPSLGARHGSFGGLGGNTMNGNGPATDTDSNAATSGLARIRSLLKAPEETVTVTELPEKEGMFLFQHRNYQVYSTRRNSRVVRRYSDFVWLLDCLHKRYPFRQLPLLPPKRLGVNGHHLSADATFLERRRLGLTRFANALVRHPILNQEQLVIMFLTVPTELSVWRKQATISIADEFASSPCPTLDPPLPPETFTTIRSGLRRSADLYINLCNLLDRLEKRQQGVAADYARFATALRSLTDASEATYAIDTSDVPALNNGLLAVAAAMNTSRTLLLDESRAYTIGALEDLKALRDSLVSLRELFVRIETALAATPVPALERRILKNEGRGKTEEEREKWKVEVEADRRRIEEWRERARRIAQNTREELEVFQKGMGGVGRCMGEWARERVKFSELQGEVWRGLMREVEGMPGGE